MILCPTALRFDPDQAGKGLHLIQIKTELAIGDMDLMANLRCNNSELQLAALGHLRSSQHDRKHVRTPPETGCITGGAARWRSGPNTALMHGTNAPIRSTCRQAKGSRRAPSDGGSYT